MKRIALLAGLLVALAAPGPAADWEADPAIKAQRKAAATLERLRDKVPATAPYFEQAYGYAVLPTITRIGFGIGGAYGSGLVIEQDRLIGRTRFWQFTSGIQAGGKGFSMIVFFRDREALEHFRAMKLQFMGQAGAALGPFGVSKDPAYHRGVAIFALTRGGLMVEATISGASFTFKPVANEAAAPAPASE